MIRLIYSKKEICLFLLKYIILLLLFMQTKTKVKKALVALSLSALIVAPFSTNITTFAASSQIGTGSVSGNGAFNSAIMWDWNLPWTASGTVSWIIVTATVTPTLDMALSTWAINLGTLNSSTYSTWGLFVEIWTNAVSWVVVTAKSNSGWLTNITNSGVQINDLSTDWVAESYRFSSTTWAVIDSTVSGYTAASNLSTEVNNNSTQTIYTTNKPEQTNGINDVDFKVAAKIDAQTPGWSYKDTINFTVSGTF